MNLIVDGRMREYIFDHGWRIGTDGRIIITRSQVSKVNLQKSIRKPGIKCLTLPSDTGLCLIYEEQHFVITD